MAQTINLSGIVDAITHIHASGRKWPEITIETPGGLPLTFRRKAERRCRHHRPRRLQ